MIAFLDDGVPVQVMFNVWCWLCFIGIWVRLSRLEKKCG